MKKALLTAIIILGFGVNAFAQVENAAKDVLTAYKNRDVELLKKYAPAVLKSAISQSYFTDKAIQEDLKAVDGWDGKIREVRYENNNIMGANVLMATVYFADAPDSNELYAVLLSNFNNTGWAIFGNGISREKREEFERLSKTAPAPDIQQTNSASKTEPTKEINRNFSIEMADGDIYDRVSEEKLVELFGKLNDDNFYIILNNGDNYLQAAYSEQGYTVEYQNESGHFVSLGLLSKDETVSLLRKYYQGKEGWEKGIAWDQD